MSSTTHNGVEASVMDITTVGIDLAKNFFQIHGVNRHGKPLLRKQLRREQMEAFFANLPPCLVGLEACASAHHWARRIQAFGHTVRLMAPQFVKPYVKSNKNDAADAEAICEAVTRPSMRFVPIKNVEQQAVLSLHRASQGGDGLLRAAIAHQRHADASNRYCWVAASKLARTVRRSPNAPRLLGATAGLP